MKSLKCIIVDDEPLARKGIALNVKEISWLENCGEFQNALLASDFLAENEIDLIFLDIEMPGLKGLDFLRGLKSDCLTILTTAYPQYALEAFELEVVDYLMKPIKFERFFKAVNKVREIRQLYRKQEEQETTITTGSTDGHFFIRSDRKYVKIAFDDLLWVKGLKDYVLITTPTAKHMTALNIKTILSKLPDDRFCRVSKSYIVNTAALESIDGDLIEIAGEEIPIGPSFRDDFLRLHVKNRLLKR